MPLGGSLTNIREGIWQAHCHPVGVSCRGLQGATDDPWPSTAQTEVRAWLNLAGSSPAGIQASHQPRIHWLDFTRLHFLNKSIYTGQRHNKLNLQTSIVCIAKFHCPRTIGHTSALGHILQYHEHVHMVVHSESHIIPK